MPAVSYRAATLDDAEVASDVMTASYPSLPQDPVLTRYRWQHPRVGYEYARFLAQRDGASIAYLGWIHGPWSKLPERHCEVEVWLDRGALDRSLLTEMWAWIGADAVAQGSGILLAYCAEDEPEMLEALAQLGYERARAEKVWELDLNRLGRGLIEEAAEARRRMDEAGVRLVTLAVWEEPDRLRRLFELSERTVQDVPHTLPIVPEAFEDFERRALAPDRRQDRWWLAVAGHQPVAMTYLKFPPVRGTVWTGFTCTDPDYRGRGIARAVKLQSLAQAAQLGIPVVCTDNDSENAPMLHINETLGYVRRPGFVEHHKRVKNISA
jgi:GNAT superfamily N-acetyltransferase